jgi:hypothetical protein
MKRSIVVALVSTLMPPYIAPTHVNPNAPRLILLMLAWERQLRCISINMNRSSVGTIELT